MSVSPTLPRRRMTQILDAGMDAARFLVAWLHSPRDVAAIVPSSRALAALITRDIDARSGCVLELGAGTGAFTQALVERGVDEGCLTLVESDSGFARLLRSRFRRARVLEVDASDLVDVPSDKMDGFGATICGLGLLNMTAAKVEVIIAAAFGRMTPTAAFYVFTYGRRCSVSPDSLARLGLRAERVGTAWRNIPPASVYRITRTGHVGG